MRFGDRGLDVQLTTIVIVMGVSGAGKTTIGTRLAAALGWPFHEADDYHSEQAKARMAEGTPLTDADRAPWLGRLSRLIADSASAGQSMVLACSALKQAYRRQLADAGGAATVVFVYLKVPVAVAEQRLKQRKGHFATADLAPSQFADLEEPADAIVVDATRSPEEVVFTIRRRLAAFQLSRRGPG